MLFAVAILVAGTGAFFTGGLLMFAGCGIFAIAMVVAVRGDRGASTESTDP